MKLAINKTFTDKAKQEEFARIVKTFQNVEVSRDELAQLINEGYAFCAQHSDNYKKSANFTSSDILAVDIDDGMTVQDALANEFVRQHAAILYTTVNHSEEFQRFRIVFEVETTITSSTDMKNALRGVIKKFGGDPSCNDACRMFYGSKGSKPITLKGSLTADALAEVIALGEEINNKNVITDSVSGNNKTTTIRSINTISSETKVQDRDNVLHRLVDLPEKTSVHCPVHIDNNASAFTVRSKQGVVGVHCSRCQTTYFTSSDMPLYDFNYGLRNLDALSREEVEYTDEEGYLTYSEPAVLRIKERYLPQRNTTASIIFVRSPKGTGKTQWLASIVNEMKARYVDDEKWRKEKEQWEQRGKIPHDEYQTWLTEYQKWKTRARKKSILLIGHRRSLITSVAARLGLRPYIEFHDVGSNGKVVDKISYNNPTQYYAISVDSLSQKLKPKIHKYDYVLIDEVEQVFSHLTSDTLKGKRNDTYHFLKHYVDVAEQVYVMDADLNYLTVETICNFVSRKSEREFEFIHNESIKENRDIHLYGSEEHLTSELMKSIENREKCFVCTNSKKHVKKLVGYIQEKYGESCKVIGITSENSQQAESQGFIRNIKTQVLEYDVVLVSPSVGTGVDITFDDNAQFIDVVYGFFQARVNTHFDIDQQLCRVRNPKSVKVWITPETFRFETEPSIIKHEVIATSKQAMKISHIDSDGEIHYHTNDGYLELYANVNSIRRGSINHLKQHFINMKEYEGWTVIPVDMTKEDIVAGAEINRVAKEIQEQERIENILSAPLITKHEYIELFKAQERYSLTPTQKYAMRRYEIESFYYTDASNELIHDDRDGKKRAEIREYENYMSADSVLMAKDQLEVTTYNTHITDRKTWLARKRFFRDVFTLAGLADANSAVITERCIHASDLTACVEYIEKNKTKIQRWFDIDLRKDMKEKPVQQLGVFLKLMGSRGKRNQRKHRAGARSTTIGYPRNESMN